jgi:hypothetical protein
LACCTGEMASKAVEPCPIIKSNGDIDNCVIKLLAHCFDKNEQVKVSVACALFDLGVKQTPMVLSSAVNFVQTRSAKLEHGHRVAVLTIICRILEGAREQVDEALARQMCSFLADEMVASAEVKTDWQTPASTGITLLAGVYCDIAIDELLTKFTPGQEPHYFVVKTFADISAANGTAFIMRMGSVLSRVIPVLGNVKKSPMKWVFSTALGRFAEAITHFKSNANAEQKGKIEVGHFAADMVSAWDVIFTKWIIAKESKVRMAVAESLGYMSSALASDVFEDRFNKLVMHYFASYKKEKTLEHLPISSGFVSLLTHATELHNQGECHVLEPALSQILNGLYPYVCRAPDATNPALAKNHNEMLRCFEVCGRCFLPQTLNFVIGRFATKETSIKIGSLAVLRHFVNSLTDVIEDQKPLIMSSVIRLVAEPDLGVRKAIMQLIVSMSNSEYLLLEGGQTLVEFIVRQCALPEDKPSKKPPSGVTPGQLRQASNHILYVMATKVEAIQPVLWPFLFEMYCKPEFVNAVHVITKSVGAIGAMKRETNASDYMIDFRSNVNVPSAQHIAVRLMVIASLPNQEPGLGVSVVKCMQALGPVLNADLAKCWDEHLPVLLEHLETSSTDSTDLNETQWQDSMLRLFKQTLSVITDKQWLRELVQALTSSFPLYKGQHEYKRSLQRFVGAVVAALDAKALISESIDLMISNVDHSSDAERQGHAQGLGLAAKSHLDTVLPKLDVAMAPPKSSGGGFFGFGGGSKKAPDDVVSTCLLGYGYVSAYADGKLMLSRLDVHVMHNLVPVLKAAKSPLIKVHCIKAIDLIGKALHKSRLPDEKKDFVLQERDTLLSGVLVLFQAGVRCNNELRLLGLNAASTLTNLEPPLSTEMRDTMLKAVVPYYGTEGANSDEQEGKSKKSRKASADLEEEKAEDNTVAEMILANMSTLLTSVIHMEPTITVLVDVTKRLDQYVFSTNVVERERATGSYLVLMKKFVTKAVHEKCPQEEKSFPEIGERIASIMPRCTDTVLATRQAACEALQAVLYVDQILENQDNPKPAQEIRLMTEIRNRMEARTLHERLGVIKDLSGLVTEVLTLEEVVDTLVNLLGKVEDPDPDAATGVAHMIRGIVNQKGSAIASIDASLASVVQAFLAAVSVVSRPQVKAVVLSTFRALVKCAPEALIKIMLDTKVPLPRETSECFVAVVEDTEDSALALTVLKYFFTVLNETPIDSSTPTPLVMAATCALDYMLPVPAIKELITSSYPALLCSLLMRVGTSYGCDDGMSSDDAVRTLETFLTALEELDILDKMNSQSVWDKMKTEEYDDAITEAACIFCEFNPDKKRAMLKFLARFFSQQSYTGQRVVATAILAEFVTHSGDDDALLKQLITFILPRVVDSVPKIRKQALRGIGNLVTVWNSDTKQSAGSLLSALTSAMEDTEPQVAAEAVASLTRLTAAIDEETIGPNLINICFRMRQAFDRKEFEVRKAAFTLFGAMCRYGENVKSGSVSGLQGLLNNFMDQVHTNVPIFVSHINDDHEEVRQSAVDALQKVAPLLGPGVVECAKTATADPQAWDLFVTDFSIQLSLAHGDRVRNYVDGCTSYLESQWMGIRGNAAYLSASLVAQSNAEVRRSVNINALCGNLTKLLAHESPLVRSRAAKAISLMFDV